MERSTGAVGSTRIGAAFGLRLLHYWWPVAMAASLAMVVARATGRVPDASGMRLLLLGVAAAYSLDRVLDPDSHADPVWLRRVLMAVGMGASAASLLIVGQLPMPSAFLVPVLGGVVLLYSRLKRIVGLKTVIVATVWTWAAIALPFPDGSWLGWRAWSLPVALPLTMIVAAGCVLCDLKDADRDRVSGATSLPVTLGIPLTAAIAIALASIGAAAAWEQGRYGLVAAAGALALLATRPSWLARDVAGPLSVDIILSVPGLLVALHIL